MWQRDFFFRLDDDTQKTQILHNNKNNSKPFWSVNKNNNDKNSKCNGIPNVGGTFLLFHLILNSFRKVEGSWGWSKHLGGLSGGGSGIIKGVAELEFI